MVIDPKSLATVNAIYWTHTAKCFIQKERESVKAAKERLSRNFNNAFDKACLCCKEYLWREIDIVQPKLIVLIGGKAFNAIFPKMKDAFGKQIKKSKAEIAFTYHPNRIMKGELKKKGFDYIKERIKGHF